MSLADLLVSIAVLGLLLGATFAVLAAGQQAYAIGAARVESQQSARLALARLAGEIRVAGSGAASAALAAIPLAEPARIVLHVDVNGDGVVAGRRETITWTLAGSVLRRDAGGGAQPIINGVRSLALAYLDAAGRVTDVPEKIRSVSITLTTESDRAPPGAGRAATTTVSTRVRLRNR